MINILFFASLRDQLNCEQTTLEVTEPAQVTDVIDQLTAAHPQWQAPFRNTKVLCAVNQDIVNTAHWVNAGDEVAFFPPVTGG